MPENDAAPNERGGESPREAHARRKVRMRKGVAAASLATVMTSVAQACTAVSSVDGLYDCQGKADALAAQS